MGPRNITSQGGVDAASDTNPSPVGADGFPRLSTHAISRSRGHAPTPFVAELVVGEPSQPQRWTGQGRESVKRFGGIWTDSQSLTRHRRFDLPAVRLFPNEIYPIPPKHSSCHSRRNIGNDIGARGFFFLALVVGSIVRSFRRRFVVGRHHPPDGRRPSASLPTEPRPRPSSSSFFIGYHQHPLIASRIQSPWKNVCPRSGNNLGSKTPV